MNILRFRIAVYLIASAIDLVTTVALLGAGRAIEANPIAARFAHDPVQLIAFKMFVTFLVVVTACRLARSSRSLAESGMAMASAFTILVVALGLSTVPPQTRIW